MCVGRNIKFLSWFFFILPHIFTSSYKGFFHLLNRAVIVITYWYRFSCGIFILQGFPNKVPHPHAECQPCLPNSILVVNWTIKSSDPMKKLWKFKSYSRKIPLLKIWKKMASKKRRQKKSLESNFGRRITSYRRIFKRNVYLFICCPICGLSMDIIVIP